MLTSLQIKFLILIFMVFLITIGFAILIWRQTIVVEKKALAAKQRQKECQQNQPELNKIEKTNE